MKLIIFTMFVVISSGCTKKTNSSEQLSAEQLFERGQSIYKLNCISCHNTDPSKDGLVGPSIKGSSKELLEARILKAGYPPNYNPKRDTKQMPALPQLEKEIQAIEAFLK